MNSYIVPLFLKNFDEERHYSPRLHTHCFGKVKYRYTGAAGISVWPERESRQPAGDSRRGQTQSNEEGIMTLLPRS